jgi:hypothetical protein
MKCISEINMMSMLYRNKRFQFFCMLCQAVGIPQGK